MASPVSDTGASHQQQHHPASSQAAADSAFQEAQKWIEVSADTPREGCGLLRCLVVLVTVCSRICAPLTAL